MADYNAMQVSRTRFNFVNASAICSLAVKQIDRPEDISAVKSLVKFTGLIYV